MRRSASALAAAFACGLMLTACGTEEGIPDGGTDRGLADDATPSPTTPPPLDVGSEAEPFDCFDVSPSSPGVYTVAEAGTVEIDTVDDGFRVASVETEDGWRHEIQEDDGLRIEVRFHPLDGNDDQREGARDDDEISDAADAREHLADSVDEEVLVLVIAQGPSADDPHAVAELCTSLI